MKYNQVLLKFYMPNLNTLNFVPVLLFSVSLLASFESKGFDSVNKTQPIRELPAIKLPLSELPAPKQPAKATLHKVVSDNVKGKKEQDEILVNEENFAQLLAEAKSLLKNGRSSEAIQILLALEAAQADNIEVLAVLASTYEAQKQWFAAIIIYNRILMYAPKAKDVIHKRVSILKKLGLTKIPEQEAKKAPSAFSSQEKISLKWDGSARHVRWGKLAEVEGVRQFDETDEAIRLLRENIRIAQEAKIKEAFVWENRARFDLIIALRDRFYMDQVIEEYQILKQQKIDIPSYVLTAVADAYLYLEKPEKARDLYRSVLKTDPSNFDVQISLFYALVKSEQIDEAVEWIDQVAANQPAILRSRFTKGMPARVKGNPKKTSAETLSAVARIYLNDLEGAQQRLELLHKKAPFNQEIRTELARIYLLRGWPRKAEKLNKIGLASEPKDLGVKAEYASTLLELNDYRHTELTLNQLTNKLPYDKGIIRQKEEWDIHNFWELQIRVNAGGSTGSAQGSEEVGIDTILYSQPFNHNYRAFARYRWNRDVFPEGVGYAQRQGGGIEYRRRNLLLVGEFHNTMYDETNDKHKLGGRATASYQFNDEWQATVEYDSVSTGTPLRALNIGVTSQSASANIDYRINESLKFNLSGSYLDFSDGNQRYIVQASHYERWIIGPKYTMSTTASIAHSGNSLNNTIYFNPRNDLSFAIKFDNEYLTYRSYDFSFVQDFALTAGGYWQEGFGTDPVGIISYEHRWRAKRSIDFTYGVAGYTQVYDGIREYGWRGFMQLNWRF